MRRHTYHVITPMYRVENLRKLIPMLEKQDVQWHVISDDEDPFRLHFRKPWIHSYVCPNRETTFFTRCNFAINWFLSSYPLNDGDRYQILNDDDSVEDGFYEKIDNHESGVIIPSMARGHHTPADAIPERAHAFTTLIAAPQNMHVGGVGVEQMVICGRLLKLVRLPLSICGDGEMITYCVNTFGADYAPEALVYFNRFERGRWDEPAKEA